MTDGVIKGTGNSRYLKTVAEALTLYPTYEAFIQALVSGTLPVDFNGINADGWTMVGTQLNKANLLTDATEIAIWGSAANRTVNAALNQINSAIVSAVATGAKIATGSYVGTGTYGESNPCSLTFSFVPKLVAIKATDTYHGRDGWTLIISGLTRAFTGGDSYYGIFLTWLSKGIRWYTDGTLPIYQLNIASTTYNYFAIG